MIEESGKRKEKRGLMTDDRRQMTEDAPVEHPGRGPGSTGQGGQRIEKREERKQETGERK